MMSGLGLPVKITLWNLRQWEKYCVSQFLKSWHCRKNAFDRVLLMWKIFLCLLLYVENHYNTILWVCVVLCILYWLSLYFALLHFPHINRRANHVIIYHLYLPVFLLSSLTSFFSVPSLALRASCEIRNQIILFCKVSKWHLSRRSKLFLLKLWRDSRRCHAASSNSVYPNRTNVSF